MPQINSLKSLNNGRLALAFGVLSIMLGVLLNEWQLPAIFSPDGQIAGSTRFLIRLFDLGLITIGTLLILYRQKLNFELFQEGDNSFRKLFFAGIVIRILVYLFLGPHNNDPHIEIIDYIVNRHELPVTGQLTDSFHPPLYYLLASLFAYSGSAKIVQLFSLLLSLGNFYLLFDLIKTTGLIRDYKARCHALTLTALLPQFVLFSLFVSNDTLSFLVGTLLFLLSFRYISQPTNSNLLFLAAMAGIGLLTKGSFLAWAPLLPALVVVVGLRWQETLTRQFRKIVLLFLVALTIGSYKFIENTVYLGTPIPAYEGEFPSWLVLQQGTYQGLKSIYDVNIAKLIHHPFLSEHTWHSLPLLFYSTFWYGYIPYESNFSATREFPLSIVPRLIYLFGIVPIGLMLIGAIGIIVLFFNQLVRTHPEKALNRSSSDLPGGNPGSPQIDSGLKTTGMIPTFRIKLFSNDCDIDAFNLQIKKILLLSIFLLNLGLVMVWGLKHDAWSFFQARLLFPSFLAVAVLFGNGFETICKWRPAIQPLFTGVLVLQYVLLAGYFIIELGSGLVRLL